MTYIASVHNAYNGSILLTVKQRGAILSKIMLPAEQDTVSRALRTYNPLKVRVASDVPKPLRSIGSSLDRLA
ncbi:MAG TPA: hypothetical protein VJH95_03460 [Candidatus Nanoarchaeia archaeon]|nr:hypothetical protein [Candidatus Nanoarchaeia archaeon]